MGRGTHFSSVSLRTVLHLAMPLKPSIDFSEFISFSDLAVFFGILLLTLFAAYWGNLLRKRAAGINSLLEYLVMGRALSLPLFVATLVSTWYGGIFGVTQIAFEHGVYNFVTQGLFWYVAYLIFAFFLVDRIRGVGAVTLPELVGKIFGPRAEKVAGVFNFFNVLPIAYVISIGLFIQVIFGGELLICTVIGTVLIAFYAMAGGLRSVVFSDLIQFTVMCLSVFVVAVYSVASFGGLEFLRAKLPTTHFSPTGGHSWATTLVWGFIALETLVDPTFYQRCFAAKNTKVARHGILISTLVWCGFDLCTTMGGLYARALVPEAQSNQSYLIYAMQILPSGLRGFFLAGILATILSTLDSFLFVAANTVSYDLSPKRFRKSVRFNHICTFAVAIFTVFLSSVFNGSIEDAWKTIGSYSAGCLLLPMMIGLFRPGMIGEISFIMGTTFGVVGITYWRLTEHVGFLAEVDDFYVGVLATACGIVLGKWIERKLHRASVVHKFL